MSKIKDFFVDLFKAMFCETKSAQTSHPLGIYALEMSVNNCAKPDEDCQYGISEFNDGGDEE